MDQVVVGAGVGVGIDDHDAESKVAADVANGGGQVGVVGDDDGLPVVAGEAVDEEAGGEVDVGALLFGVSDADVGGISGPGPGQRAVLDAFAELAVVDFETGQRGQGAEICLLTSFLLRVVGS